MTVSLISGGAGFLGSHLVDKLLLAGHRVLAVDNMLTAAPGNLDHIRSNSNLQVIRADVSKPLEVREHLDYIWHLASPASPDSYLKFHQETMKVGSAGTLNLLELARRNDARFLLASTSEVYGDPEVTPQKETYWGHANPIGLRSVYDEAKRFAEAATYSFHRHFGLATRIARIFNAYGPRMRLDDGRIVPNFVGQALRGEPLTIYGDGTQTRSFCYGTDTVDGLAKLMMSDFADPINIGDPSEMTILQFADAVERVSGRKLGRVYQPLPGDDPRRRQPDITRAKTILGWKPTVGLEEGLQETFKFFRGVIAASQGPTSLRPSAI